MRDRLLFATIGLLVGIVVMQWMMPSGSASVSTPPAGNIIAADGDMVMTATGAIWFWAPSSAWVQFAQSPVPADQVQFFSVADLPELSIVAKNGDQWEYKGGSTGEWVNHGQAPLPPVATNESTWGKIKAKFGGGQ